MKDDKESGAPHWSKDFVEHLRTVHFALITVSVALVLLVVSSRPYEPTAAISQLEALQERATTFKLDPVLAKYVPMDSYGNGSELAVRVPREELWTTRVVRFLKMREGDQFVNESDPSYQAYMSKFQGTDLLSLRDWWALHTKDVTFAIALSINNNGQLSYRGGKSNINLTPPTPTSKRISTIILNYLDLSLENFDTALSQRDEWAFVGKSPGGEFEVAFPATVKIVVVHGAEVIPMLQTCISFETCFPDLAKASKGLELLKLPDLKNHLIQQIEKGDTVFEAFGLKVPLPLLTSWGIIVVLSVQLYFFLHLREFHAKIKPHDTGWDVPWIGAYSSGLSRSVYFTTILMPTIAVALLASRASLERAHAFVGENSWDDKSLVLATIGLLALSVSLAAWLSWLTWKHRLTAIQPPRPKTSAEAR